MPLPKKIWKISRYDKGVGNFNSEGMFWWTQNLDLEATPPYLRVAAKLIKEVDSATVTTLGDIFWGVNFNSATYVINMLDGKVFTN